MPPRKKKPAVTSNAPAAPKPARGKKTATPQAAATPVEATKHQDRRSNIPTRELSKFADDDERKPKTVLYPRDPSLDPQLVWKGKDEQDRNPLEVPAVPIYIQEKIHPQALVEEVRLRAEREKRGGKPVDLFADFNGLDDFEKKVDFYKHDQHWTNRMILGDSLLVMTSLAEKERLKGRVQMIYLDPPYGIKFGSNWQVSTRKRDVKDAKIDDLTRQPEQVKAFRDTWELGIHSYLTYMRDRLTVARDLLTESGSVFVQIGDENVHLVRSVMDEVFGSENFCTLIVVRKSGGTTSDLLASPVDYLLWFAKDKRHTKYRQLYSEKVGGSEGAGVYSRAKGPDGTIRKLTNQEMNDPTNVPAGWKVLRYDVITSQGFRKNTTVAFDYQGKSYHPGPSSNWKATIPGMQNLARAGRIAVSGSSLAYVRFIEDFPVYPLDAVWPDTGTGSFTDQKIYVVQTGTKIIQRCLLMTTDPGDLVLDPTCGSGTTAYVAEQWGRRWITIDTSRVALALARTRLMAGRFPFYLLADSFAGRKKEYELLGAASSAGEPGRAGEPGCVSAGSTPEKLPVLTQPGSPLSSSFSNDIKRGFVYKRVPHVTLKSIANNPDIKEGMTREEIDAAIAKHAETETLFDQPYEDKGTIRVSGPFTVESLSPHRMLPFAAGSPLNDNTPPSDHAPLNDESDFVHSILDNLRKAGVQNTVKNERLNFERLDLAAAGLYVHAEGEYLEGNQRRRVKVCIGPQFGTVDPQLVSEAAKEAVQGFGCDLLLVCGFAFDPHVGEESKQYGKLRILCTKMNPDLALGHDMLKKTGAGNLFMVFGEPDVEVTSGLWLVTSNGRMVVNYEQYQELSGLGSLEEINRLGGADLPGFKELSPGGKVRPHEPTAAGGGVGSVEHRGGSRSKRNGGVSAVSERGVRITRGNGNTDHTGQPSEDARRSDHAAHVTTGGRNQSDAGRAETLAAIQTLEAADFPLSLTTSHFTQATIRGVDVFDPTTGAIRSHSTADIACWFIDSAYNGESFFVRHAYFCGGDEPYEKLKRALKAEVDEAEWSKLYSTTSVPFSVPKGGKIAVKVINHYGDEVLKVYAVK